MPLVVPVALVSPGAQRIQDAFQRFGEIIAKYHGHVRELRGDALLAEFQRASDGVSAAVAFQSMQVTHNEQLDGDIELKTLYRDGTTHVSFPDRLLGAICGRFIHFCERPLPQFLSDEIVLKYGF